MGSKTPQKRGMVLKALGIAFTGICLAYLLYTVHFMDFHRQYDKHHPGTCTHIEGINFGSEDIEVLSDGLAFITSGVALHSPFQTYYDFMEKNKVKGRVYTLDLNRPEASLTELKLRDALSFNPDTFKPHGLSLLEDKVDGEHLLYIINHVLGDSDRIEKFRYMPDTQELVHLKSFSSDLLGITNDIVATSEDYFYIANSMYYNAGIMAFLEFSFNLPLGNLLYFDGSKFTIMSSGLAGPNGMALSRDGRHMYLATSKNKGIAVFEHYPNNSLHLVQHVISESLTDNLHISQDGRQIFAGMQPVSWKILYHMVDPAQPSPSRVVSYPLKEGKIVEDQARELFYDNGDLISASSIGVVYKDKLFVGSLLDKLVVCDLPQAGVKT